MSPLHIDTTDDLSTLSTDSVLSMKLTPSSTTSHITIFYGPVFHPIAKNKVLLRNNKALL